MRVNLGKIKGSDGEQGPQGVQGIQGPQGTQGVQGATPTVTIGTVTTGEEGTAASATLTGTPPNYVLNLVIPRGESGGGDMKASKYAPNREPTDIFAYIDAKGVTFDGGTFTGAVLLRNTAPETDAEAVPKGYVDISQETVIGVVNEFIGKLNESKAVIKRTTGGEIIFDENSVCSISPGIEDSHIFSVAEINPDGQFVEFTYPTEYQIGRQDGKKSKYFKTKSCTAGGSYYYSSGTRAGDVFPAIYLVDENNNEYPITGPGNELQEIQTPGTLRIKVKIWVRQGYPLYEWHVDNFQAVFEEREEFDEITLEGAEENDNSN